MPSGHAQLVTNNLVFLYLLTNNNFVTGISIVITLLTLWQRYIFRMHTFSQLFCGSLLGCMTGYISYIIYKSIMLESSEEIRNDDNHCPNDVYNHLDNRHDKKPSPYVLHLSNN